MRVAPLSFRPGLLPEAQPRFAEGMSAQFPPIWHHRSLIVWLLSVAQSRFGSALSGVALSFLVLDQTGSVGSLSLTLALAFLPTVLMPLAGVWLDRLNLRWVLMLTDLANAALQLSLGGAALLLGHLPPALIYAAALLGGLVGAWSQPAARSALPRLVPPEELTRAGGLLSSAVQVALLLGFLTGGLLVARLGAPLALLLDGLTYLFSALAVAVWVKLPEVAPAQREGAGY
ncbi:MFS transporter [Deinococcus radiophilus]|nr:MFS transporter [Deinococcus radiophilus]